MSDQNIDGETGKSTDHSEASLVPKAGADEHIGPKQIGGPAKSSPKEIVLQRLTPNSSWDDPSLKNGPARDKAPEPAVAPEAASRRSLSLAAIVTIAAAVGAAGGSAATFGIGHFTQGNEAQVALADQGRTMDSAIAKVNAEIASLKAAAAAQTAKLIKLSEATDKLHAPEITGSITPPVSSAAIPNRLPVVDGWVLRDVGEGAARVEGRLGIYEVYPGDPLPGVGRVDAIRKQDGRWVVVTSRGLIVER